MKNVLFYFSLIVIPFCSCQKEEVTTPESPLNESFVSTDSQGTTKAQVINSDAVSIFVGTAPTPSINGEVQLALSKALPYPVYVHFKIKDYVSSAYISPNLVSSEFTIPAGQRYVVCDIDDYYKATSQPDSSILYVHSNLMVQICNVYDDFGNVDYMVNYSILKLDYSFSNVYISYFLKAAGAVDVSLLSCGSNIFYKPVSDEPDVPDDPKLPIDPKLPPFLPID